MGGQGEEAILSTFENVASVVDGLLGVLEGFVDAAEEGRVPDRIEIRQGRAIVSSTRQEVAGIRRYIVEVRSRAVAN